MNTVGFKLKLYLFLLFATIVLSTLTFSALEDLSFLDAFYFSIVTIATVGYGDICPKTSIGKIFTLGLIIAGVGTFLEVIAGLTQVMIGRRDRELRIEKLNMIRGIFFSEIGTKLLRMLSKADPNRSLLADEYAASGEWSDGQFQDGVGRLAEYDFQIRVDDLEMMELCGFLGTKGDLLLRFLENPSILEQESFTELLRAIFHLRDELLNRENLTESPNSDKEHLNGDMERIYRLLASHWLMHMQYLRKNYPYLFSLAARTNPFEKNATAVIYD